METGLSLLHYLYYLVVKSTYAHRILVDIRFIFIFFLYQEYVITWNTMRQILTTQTLEQIFNSYRMLTLH